MLRPYRVVCDASDPTWLEERTKLVCGSEMSIVLGCAPSWMKKTREELAEEKRSGAAGGFQPTRRMLWGSLCERRNIADMCAFTGVRARPMNVLLARGRVGATLDGLCRIPLSDAKFRLQDYCGSTSHACDVLVEMRDRAGQFCALEAKQTDFLGEWKSACPAYYQTQVQTQLYVLGLDTCLAFAKVGASDMRLYFVDADPFAHEEIEEAVAEFWKEVARD